MDLAGEEREGKCSFLVLDGDDPPADIERVRWGVWTVEETPRWADMSIRRGVALEDLRKE